jgi:signal transduction histidine kinase
MIKIKIKSKLSLGLSLFFLVVLITGGAGLISINKMSRETKNILKNNFQSLIYVSNMQKDLVKCEISGNVPATNTISDFEQNLEGQEKNAIEADAIAATMRLRKAFEIYRLTGNTYATDSLSKATGKIYSREIRTELNNITAVSMNSITRNSDMANQTADKAKLYLWIMVIICLLISFSLMMNFPGYIANPIREFSEGIKRIANKDYSYRINLVQGDEFGELATAFNSMAEQLNEYEHSNLASVIFEKERIETIINGMKDPIIGLDEKGNILFANASAIKILGLNGADLIGKYAPDVALKNDLLRNLLNESKSQAPIKIYADEKESYFNKEVLKIVVDDKSIGEVIMLKNITQFRELDLAKTNFIATISHELKTPIASIKMGIKLLEDDRIGSINPEQKKLIINIKEDTQRLLTITGELLDLSQVESGNIQLERSMVSPQSIMDYAYNALKVQAEQKKVIVRIQSDTNMPKVNCDAEKTAWVMVNFLSNAIRYSPDGAEVLVTAKMADNSIIFSTTDHGRGIDPKYKARVFDKFYKIPNADTAKSGTGLGLAISKEFIIAEGGKIWVESELNEGSTFYFQLPL